MSNSTSQIHVRANTLGVEGETPSTLTTVECQPRTAGAAPAAIAIMQEKPIIVPADVSGLSPSQPFQDVKQLAYGGSKIAQQQKFDMILDDFEGLLQMAQGVTAPAAAPGGWKADYVADIAEVNKIVKLVRGEDIAGVNWDAADNDQKLALLFATPISGFAALDTVDLFSIPADSSDGSPTNLLETVTYQLTHTHVQAIMAKELPMDDGTATAKLSSNSYFMLVLALAIAQMKLGYSIAGEVQCGVAPAPSSCKARRCYQVPDAAIPIRIGILGVLPAIHDSTTILEVLESTFATSTPATNLGFSEEDVAQQAALQLGCLIDQLRRVHNNTATGPPKTALDTKISALEATRTHLESWEGSTALPPLLDAAQLEFLNLSSSNVTAASRVIQTYPLLPPMSDPLNRFRGTRNADLIEGYVMNKPEIQHQATPYYYRGGAAICSRRLPLVGLSRECPPWDPQANNVVPFEECSCGASPPPLPTTCSCKPATRIESVLALVRKSGPQLDLATMLLGFNVNWLANVVEGDDNLLSSTSTYYAAAQKAMGSTSIRDVLESNSQVFIPGAAGAFYTNLMVACDEADDLGTLPASFYQGTDSRTARKIADAVIGDQSIPITAKLALQQRIVDGAANQMVVPVGRREKPVELQALLATKLAVQEEADQLAANYDAKSNPVNTFTASVSRMYELDPISPAGVALEGRSVGVQLVDNIVVTVPLTYSLKDKVADAVATASGVHSATEQALTAAIAAHVQAGAERDTVYAAYQTALAEQAADDTGNTTLAQNVADTSTALDEKDAALATAADDRATKQAAHAHTLVEKLETLASDMRGYPLEADSVACQGCASCP